MNKQAFANEACFVFAVGTLFQRVMAHDIFENIKFSIDQNDDGTVINFWHTKTGNSVYFLYEQGKDPAVVFMSKKTTAFTELNDTIFLSTGCSGYVAHTRRGSWIHQSITSSSSHSWRMTTSVHTRMTTIVSLSTRKHRLPRCTRYSLPVGNNR